MKIDTALYNNKKQHQLEGYFIVDTMILNLEEPYLGYPAPPQINSSVHEPVSL